MSVSEDAVNCKTKRVINPKSLETGEAWILTETTTAMPNRLTHGRKVKLNVQ